ncbi:retrovirus-related pol polyprotein from transposon TNT 1-94, partial [Tanacetum coccineum]
GTEFLNKTLNAFFKEEGIEHHTSTPQTPEQNDVAEAIATACYTQNRSIIIPTHDKTAYHIINDRKPSIKHLHIFGCTCYLTRDGENLDKMKEKGDMCILDSFPKDKRRTSSVNKSSSPIDNSKQQDTPHKKNIQSTTELTTLTTNVHVEENIAESSSRNIDNSNMNTFYQPQDSEYRWTKDHPLSQVHGNPSKPVQTRRQLATDPELCMFALTVITVELKTIKEAMADSAWIKAMQEELH